MNGWDFTERLRMILARAREQVASLDHQKVGTEHMLLALLTDRGSVADAVLRSCNADPEAIRTTVLQAVARGKHRSSSNLPYTWRAKKALELAMDEARSLNHSYVGTEHLLLGLLREEKGVGARALVHNGVTLERARTATLRQLGNPGG